MNKTELESKHLAELHSLAAEADVPRYRMLRREELIEKLSDGDGDGKAETSEKPRGDRPPRRERPPRQRRERSGGRETGGRERSSGGRERSERPVRKEPAADSRAAAPAAEPEAPAAPREPAAAPAEDSSRPKRKRRRRRFGRKSKGLRAQDLLLPPPGRQALVYGESRATCTSLLREIAGELAGASEGPDPIALLIDPSPEELADWKREAPDAELVVAAQARHAGDALAQAIRRAEGGEDVILLVDSLTRLDDADTAKEVFDGGLGLAAASGSLTVVAALQREQ
ncbi:MAG TPA: Rho termination factor N-terminal domain-containing protein [Solirubrobacterales bacterium]|nr:Rho termination factor N-terminal domain-containing protein [Solirubrobacterales bacterium]